MAAMKMPRISLRSRLAAAAAVATMAGSGAALATASPAAAYGPTQVYSIELSANIPGAHGGGVWLWFGLNSDGSGDYHGADCGHANAPATSDGGEVTSWEFINNGQNVEIDGVVLNGLHFTATVTVPAAFGHYNGTFGSFITVPPFIPSGAGFSQLQVAP